MAKLHSYYVTNASSKLKYIFNDISDNQYEKQVEEAIRILQFGEDNKLEDDEFIDDNEDEFINNEETSPISINFNKNINDFNNCFDFSNIELLHALEMDVSVVIEPCEPEIEHGEMNFDSNELLNSMLKK